MHRIIELQRVDFWTHRYPIRRVSIVTIGYFSTHEKALSAMNDFICDKSNYSIDEKYPEWLGFIITHYAIDEKAWRNIEPLYQCTYTHDGRFNDENLADADGVFRGRPIDKLRFDRGDIVEVVSKYDTVSLGIICGAPPTPDCCAELISKWDYSLDRGDDQYTVLFLAKESQPQRMPRNGKNVSYYPPHLHIQSQFVFAPTKPVSRSMKENLINLFTLI